MLCYDHMKAGTKKDAVAVCPICGRAACEEHVHEHTMRIRRESGWTGHETTYLLCDTCFNAIAPSH